MGVRRHGPAGIERHRAGRARLPQRPHAGSSATALGTPTQRSRLQHPALLEKSRSTLGVSNRTRLGTRSVQISKIVSSVGRHGNFDRAFSPSKEHLGQRWKRRDRMMRQDRPLPAVSLYKIGDDYFVLDGHHRVSVARHHGREWVDAEVTEVRGTAPEGRQWPSARHHRFDRRERRKSRARESQPKRLSI